MTISITPIDHGTTEGDETGETAFYAFEQVNLNEAALKSAGEKLQGRMWILDNTARTLALGERIISSAHAGIIHTTPAAYVSITTDYRDIWVWNNDSDSNITLTPASGDAFFVNGVTLGTDATQVLVPGEIAILSIRVDNTSWDLIIIGTEVDLTRYVGQQLKTDDYELVLTDAGKMIDMNKGTAVTLTIPANSAVPFPVDTRIDLNQYGVGLLTVVITTDTLRGDAVSVGQYKGLSLWKRTATEWVIFGGTTA